MGFLKSSSLFLNYEEKTTYKKLKLKVNAY